MRKSVKILSALLCLCMLFSMGLTAVSAEDSAEEEYKKAEWEINEEAFYLTLNGTRKYIPVDLHFNFHFDQLFSFEFVDNVKINGKAYKIEGNSHDPSIVVVTDQGWGYAFVDEKEEAIIKDYRLGKDSVYFVEKYDDNRFARVDETFAKALDDYEYYAKADKIEKIDVSDIQPTSEIFFVTERDRTETLVRQHGAIYKSRQGIYYYFNIEDLPNENFDSSGQLSFRKGVIAMTRLSDDLVNMIELVGLDNLEYKDKTDVYESDVLDGWIDVYGNYTYDYDDYVNDSDTSFRFGLILSFWLSFSLWGFVFPIGIILLGLLLPASKKRKNEKYWRILAIIGGIWLATSLSLMAIILL